MRRYPTTDVSAEILHLIAVDKTPWSNVTISWNLALSKLPINYFDLRERTCLSLYNIVTPNASNVRICSGNACDCNATLTSTECQQSTPNLCLLNVRTAFTSRVLCAMTQLSTVVQGRSFRARILSTAPSASRVQWTVDSVTVATSMMTNGESDAALLSPFRPSIDVIAEVFDANQRSVCSVRSSVVGRRPSIRRRVFCHGFNCRWVANDCDDNLWVSNTCTLPVCCAATHRACDRATHRNRHSGRFI